MRPGGVGVGKRPDAPGIWWLVLVEILASEGWLKLVRRTGWQPLILSRRKIHTSFLCLVHGFLVWQYAKVLCFTVSVKQVLITPLQSSVQTVQMTHSATM